MEPEPDLFCRIDSLNCFYNFQPTVEVLRLDLVHPVVSGNKWFKLQGYLRDAKMQNKIVLTFGGAYSNHIAATAAAAKQAGLKSIGIIRGEKAPALSHTLTGAAANGMELYFIRRSDYSHKQIPEQVWQHYSPGEIEMVPEGGYGLKGTEGAMDIMRKNNTSAYTHILTAVGTGTTLAGLVAAAKPEQQVIGISVFKNNLSLRDKIQQLLATEKKQPFLLLHDYHFGGYAKKNLALFQFMNQLYEKTRIPTDFVYTAKAFFAVFSLLQSGYFSSTDKLLLVHTGGLQGNISLPKGTLIF